MPKFYSIVAPQKMRTAFASLVLLALSFVCAFANTAEPSNQLTRELDSEEPWDFDGFYGADRDLMGYEDRDLIEELNIRDLNGIDKEKDRELVDGEDEEFEKLMAIREQIARDPDWLVRGS